MKRRLVLGIVLPLILAVIISTASVTPVFASPPEPASGNWKVEGTPVPKWMRMADGNTIICMTVTKVLTGDFEGTQVADVILMMHPDGKVNLRALYTFTGTVNGKSGTLLIRWVGTSYLGSGEGQWVILSGTGGLANLRGQGTWEAVAPGYYGSYSGQIHFEP